LAHIWGVQVLAFYLIRIFELQMFMLREWWRSCLGTFSKSSE